MQRLTCRSGLGLIVLVLGAVAPAAAADQPFKSSGDGALLFNPQESLSGPFAAAGHATHLGAWENYGHITFAPLSETTRGVSGCVVFEAADCDLLVMSIDGVLDATTGHATATFVIIGGTGRFADATGASHMELQDLPDGTFTFTLDGIIDY